MEKSENSKQPRRSSIKERVEKMLTRNSAGARPNSVEEDENETSGTRKRRSTYVKERALFINNKIKEGKFYSYFFTI
jgi:hypothetical protein